MDTTDLMRRATELLEAMVETAERGGDPVSPEVRSLRDEVAWIVATPGVDPEMQDVAGSIVALIDRYSDPDIAATLAKVGATPPESNPEIFDAIDDADPAAVRRALSGRDVNETFGRFHATALYHAMSSSFAASPEIMSLLLDAGADPRKGLGDTNVLHGLGFADLSGVSPSTVSEIVRRCVALGSDIEQRSDRLCWTPLITAASEWNPVAVEALLLAGADIHGRAGDVDGVYLAGEDALAFAAGHEATLAVLNLYLRPQ